MISCRRKKRRSEFLDKKKKYLNRVWHTKKSRINAAKRLLDNYSFAQFATTWYSVLLIILTLMSVDKDDIKSMILLGASIILAVGTVYSNAKNYQERYIRMKDNYIEIAKIEIKIDGLKGEIGDEEKFNKYILEYQRIMEEVENHSTLDYLLVKKQELESSQCECRKKAPKGYYWYRFLWVAPKALIVVSWIVILIIYISI